MKNGKEMLRVLCSRGVSLASGVAVSFLLPGLLGVEDYGVLKLYTLYAAYTELLHFGFADGILLRLAGAEYDSLDKEKMRMYTRFFMLFQLAVGGAIVLAGSLRGGDWRFLLVMLGVGTVTVNLTTYYQFVSQAASRFGEYSARNLMAAAAKLLFVLFLLLGQTLGWFRTSYRLYICGLAAMELAFVLWYVGTYRDITFGRRAPLCRREIGSLFRQGILLTAAYQVSHLVLLLDRQFVSLLYPAAVYGVYSFAYSIVTLISTLISSLSVVLLPALKKAGRAQLQEAFERVLSAVAVLVGAALLCYFPLTAIIRCFLPAYHGSVVYLRIVTPAMMYTCCLSVVMFTFSKALERNLVYFRNGALALGIGLLTNGAAYLLFRTPQAISWASCLTMALWFLMEGRSLSREVHGRVGRVFCYITALALSFWVIAGQNGSWQGALAYGLVYLAVTGGFYRKELGRFFRTCRRGCGK